MYVIVINYYDKPKKRIVVASYIFNQNDITLSYTFDYGWKKHYINFETLANENAKSILIWKYGKEFRFEPELYLDIC